MQTYPNYIKKILGITTEKFLETKCFEAKESENLLNQFINAYFSPNLGFRGAKINRL